MTAPFITLKAFASKLSRQSLSRPPFVWALYGTHMVAPACGGPDVQAGYRGGRMRQRSSCRACQLVIHWCRILHAILRAGPSRHTLLVRSVSAVAATRPSCQAPAVMHMLRKCTRRDQSARCDA
jgi:hypothetical protein